MTNQKKSLPVGHLITPEVRLAYPSLFEKKPRFKGSDKLTYQVVVLIPPGVDLTPFKEAMKAVAIAKWGKLPPLKPEKNPLRPCEEKEAYADLVGWHHINLHATRQPACVDRAGVPVTDPALFYGGCWAKVYINAFAWDYSGLKGVSFGLNAVQFVRDDEPLGGAGARATNVFEPLGDLGATTDAKDGNDTGDLW